MKIYLLMCFVLSAVSVEVMGESAAERIKKVDRTHPRIFVSKADSGTFRSKVKASPLLNECGRHIIEIADGIQDVPPVERIKKGKRLLGKSRQCLARVLYLSAAYRLSGEKRYVIRAEKEMLAAAAFSDWNPSHFLDVGEMTAALAIGYDWLYNDLEPEARGVIKQAIVDKGLKTSLKGGWWVSTHNNWNQICHGGLVLGALAVLEDEPDLAAEIIERAVAKVPSAMKEYEPDGAYPEGPGYWKYGTTYNVMMISALESVFKTDFGLTTESFLKSSDYYLHMSGPTGLFFNYSDCGAKGGVAPAMYWFAAKRRKPALLWRENQALKSFLAKNHNPAHGLSRLIPLLLVWADPQPGRHVPQITGWNAGGRMPVAVFRTGWLTQNETYAGLKGGSPGVNHAHMDVGSFVMDADGIRWAVDLGSQSYYSLESKGIILWNKRQDSQRWDVFRLSNLSHNTLVVDGKRQRVDGYAPIIEFSDKGPMPHAIVDMTDVYAGQLASAKRTLGMLPKGAVLIEDEIESLDRMASLRWGMVTRAAVSIESNGSRAVLTQGGKHLLLNVLSPAGVKLELFETAIPPHSYDAENRGTVMIGFKIGLPASTKETISVRLSPFPK